MLRNMHTRNFLCCLLLFIGAVQLIEARGGGRGRVGGGGGGGLFSGWFKSSKSSSSSPGSSPTSISSSSTSNGGGKWNRQSYTPPIWKPYSGYRSMSYPSYNDGYNNDYNNNYGTGSGYQYQSLDNDQYAGFSTGLQTTRFVNDLMEILRMRLPYDGPETATEETFTIKPSDILEVERSMNISAWFNLIKPITDKIFDRMGARLIANIRQSKATTPTSEEIITVASQEVDEKGNVASVSEVAVTVTTPPALIGPLRTSALMPDDIDIIDYITPRATEIPKLELQSAVDAVASDSLQPVLKIMQQQQEPGKIFNVPDEIF